MLWWILAGWLLLAPSFALLVGKALARCQQDEDRMVADALGRTDVDTHGAPRGGEPTTCRLIDRNRRRATCRRTRSRT